MCILITFIVAIVSSVITLLLHCCVIVGRENNEWIEHQTMNKNNQKNGKK